MTNLVLKKRTRMNALIAFEDLDVFVVNKPYVDTDTNISYIPYMSDHEAFIGYANKCLLEGGTGCLIAHQTFTGAQYENGFF
jgi:tRNA1(Val) A37 N6-methylase TrmN6